MERREFRIIEWFTGDFEIFIFSKDGKEIEFARPIKKKDISKWKDIVNAARDKGLDLAEWSEYKTLSPSDKIWEEWCHPYFENIHWNLLADNNRDYIPQNKW